MSTNYESHSYDNGPNVQREYHEYRSYSTSGNGAPHLDGNGHDDFNLERQVQHMLPPSAGSTLRSASPLPPSANMVQQQQKYSQSSYKVQSSSSNQYSTSSSYDQQQHNRPAIETTRLKQNIDELDTLLYDLNNAKKVSDLVSSDDYSTYNDGRSRRNVHTTSYETYHSNADVTPKRQPSPLDAKRVNQPPLSSPSQVRRASPSRTLGGETVESYNYTTTYRTEEQQSYHPSPYSAEAAPPPQPVTNASYTSDLPTGAAYYAKYHSKHTHQSQQQQHGQHSRPISPPLNGTLTSATQTPPRRVEQLMTELSEFDSNVRDTPIVEPALPRGKSHYRPPSPERSTPQPSSAGPPVYYPPGEMFNTSSKSSTRVERFNPRLYPLGAASGKGNASATYEVETEEKEKRVEGEKKQGAAVVPICLPLCCAAPCVIM